MTAYISKFEKRKYIDLLEINKNNINLIVQKDIEKLIINDKNICTCVLSLDHEEHYYIKWSDNIEFIRGNLYENTKKYYVSQINYISIFYKYFHDLYKNSPKKMIDEMFKSRAINQSLNEAASAEL